MYDFHVFKLVQGAVACIVKFENSKVRNTNSGSKLTSFHINISIQFESYHCENDTFQHEN
jgi:hypothetical protein